MRMVPQPRFRAAGTLRESKCTSELPIDTPVLNGGDLQQSSNGWKKRPPERLTGILFPKVRAMAGINAAIRCVRFEAQD